MALPKLRRRLQDGLSPLDGVENRDSHMRNISIVVACRNESVHMRAFMNSLLQQDLNGFNWEIIIADGQSDDGTRELLTATASADSRISIINNPLRIVAAGLNAAIRSARGDIILRMDAHTEYARDYVRKCVDTLESTDADNVGGPARTKAEGLKARAIQAAYHSRFSTGGARFHDEHYSGYVDTLPYGCWRKEVLEQLGLFDERLVRNQDDELNLRLIRQGGRIWQSSDIMSWYHTRTTFSSLFRQYFQYGFWKVPVIRKHRLPGSWRQLVPVSFVLANIVLLLAAVATAVVGSVPLEKKVLLAWILLLAAHLVACLFAACLAAQRYGWQLLLYLPLCFVVFHLSYGLGFLCGLAYWPLAKPDDASHLSEFFIGLSR